MAPRPSNNGNLEQRDKKIEKQTSERRAIAGTLNESEKIAQILLNAETHSAILIDPFGKILAINKKAANRLGGSPEDLISKRLTDFLSPEIRKFRKAQAFEVIRTGQPIHFEDNAEDGVYERHIHPIFDDDGKISKLAIFSRDITERKIVENAFKEDRGKLEREVKKRTSELVKMNKRLRQEIEERKRAEKALRESEERFRSISASAQDGIVMMDSKGNITYWNEAAERIFGYTKEEVIGKEAHIVLIPERYHETYKKGFSRFRETGHGPLIKKTLELSAIRKNGVEFPIELSVSAIKIRGKWYSTGIVRDITDRKRAEEALRESEEKFRLLAENSTDIIYTLDIKSERFTYISPSVVRILGYTREEALSLQPKDILTPKSYQYQLEDLYRTLEDPANAVHVSKILELEMLHKDGSIVWGEVHARIIEDAAGQPGSIIGVCRDITERKRIEKKLREGRKIYRALIEDMPALVCRFLPDGTLTFVNRAYCQYFEKDREELVGQNFFLFIPNEDQEKVRSYIKSLSQETPVISYEHQVIWPNGEIRWQQWTDRALFDEKGRLEQYQAIGQDITRQKQIEFALKEKEKKLIQQAQNLEEVNTALKVLLEHRDREKKELEENIFLNIKKLVLPYLEKLEDGYRNNKNHVYLDIIRSNLEDLVSPFAKALSSGHLVLSPTELQIADLIKQGKTSKEIASLLNVSSKAVEFHRGNIRKKLGLLKKKINLRSYLQSFSRSNA
ncbi:MAG: PAS domain S-box protein [Deltaproteobacteria bacterium]|nr:PAS domain S-box protein [Deltaproteobacteria bacterium]